MNRKNKKALEVKINPYDDVGMRYLKELEQDSKYKIEVDPDDFHKMSNQHKQFVELYIQHRNLGVVQELMGLTIDQVKRYFTMYSTQQEIRRIDAAIYHRQIATNLISFDDIGHYLSSMLIGNNTIQVDRLKTKDKLQVIKLLMEFHKQRKEFINTPELLTSEDVETQLEELSVASIKQLIETNNMLNSKPEKPKVSKKELIDEIVKSEAFDKEELEYIKSLSVNELLELLKE